MIDQSTYRSVMKAEIRRAPKVLPSEGTCSEDGKGGAATAWIDVVSIIGVVVHCDQRIYNASSSFSGEVGRQTAPHQGQRPQLDTTTHALFVGMLSSEGRLLTDFVGHCQA